jgi:hypothetical protein
MSPIVCPADVDFYACVVCVVCVVCCVCAYDRYAIQNFLEVDPHLGTREDLIELVKLAHSMGMYAALFAHAPTRMHS